MRSAVALSTGRTALLDIGEAARGTVLFVPGYTGSKEDFQPLLRPLAGAGWRAVAMDQRGQYESDWAASATGYAIEALAADVLEVATGLDAGSRPIQLVGHSFGGLVARAAAIARPSLFAGLTLMDSGPAAITGPRRDVLDAMDGVFAAEGMSGVWARMALQHKADPRYAQSSPALLTFLERRFAANDPVGLVEMGRQLRTASDRSSDLARTGLPLLVLYGVDDDAWAPAIQADMATRTGATVTVIDGAAHSPAVENPPATLTALLEFWTSVIEPRQPDRTV